MVKQRSNSVALTLAISSVVITPVLLLVEISGLFLLGMILAEPANSFLIKAIAVFVAISIAALALVLPMVAFLSNKSVASRVLAGVVIAAWLITQLWVLGTLLGACSFEGCFPA